MKWVIKNKNNMEDGEEITIIAQITGKSEKSGEKEGKPWTRYVYEFGSQLKASTFDVKLKDFRSGDMVKVMYKKSGMYYNILDMKEAAPDEVQRKNQATQGSSINQDVQKYIIRQNCNQRAIEALELMWKIKPEIVTQVMEANGGDLLKAIDVLSAHFEGIVLRTG